MSTYLVYIDDSGQQDICIFTAIVIPDGSWHRVFEKTKKFRQRLHDKYSFPIRKELHTTKLIGGRGALIAKKRLTKTMGICIFKEIINFVSSLQEDGVMVFNACKPNTHQYELAFGALLNRIERTMKAKNGKAIIICDEGKELCFLKLRRKMGTHNFIPSNQAISTKWTDTGKLGKNIPLDNVIEDLVFKNSRSSYMVQLADACAYALLRKEKPLKSQMEYNIHKVFFNLNDVLFKEASPRDPYGIIR